MVEASDLRHSYSVDGRDMETIRGVNFRLARHQFTCVLGPSGCGKSTVLRILAGLLKQTSGDLLLEGTPITGPGLDRAVVFQEPALFPWLKVIANVEFGLRSLGWSKSDARARAAETLEIVGLAEYASYYPYQLSGGMRHRVAIARAWAIPNAGLLLMDEPFGALDAITRRRLQRHLIDTWLNEPRTVFYVTHDIEEAAYLSDQICVMTPGPGTIAETIDITMERPRDRNSPEFGASKTRIDEALIEASKERGR